MSPLRADTSYVDIRDLTREPVVERSWTAPLRVFLSYTTELRDQPTGLSFVAAAVQAVELAHHVPVHMEQFGAADNTADFCRNQVARCDVYAGVIGCMYGTPVPDRPDLSYTELEFESATRYGLTRLLFIIREDVAPRRPQRGYVRRQMAFRRRLHDSGLMVCTVTSPHDLKIQVYHSLVEHHGG